MRREVLIKYMVLQLITKALVNQLGVCFGGTESEPLITIIRSNGAQHMLKGTDLYDVAKMADEYLTEYIAANTHAKQVLNRKEG